MKDKIKRVIDRSLGAGRCDVEARFGEPLAGRCTFGVGGPAECLLRASGDGFPDFASALFALARAEGVPVFPLGGGANTVFPDSGFRGIVLDTGGWVGAERVGERRIRFRSGTSVDEAVEVAASAGLSGLEFLAGMPGSVGGAAWMNARCYGRDVAGALCEVEEIDLSGRVPERARRPADPAEFGYKRSPFQRRGSFILSASFRLEPRSQAEMRAEMDRLRRDREEKGHYRLPCAGSVFKNDPAHGGPVGRIVDGLGLRGLRVGGAQVAPWHGNIIVNAGGATAADVLALAAEVAARVKAATGFDLEPEIVFAPGGGGRDA